MANGPKKAAIMPIIRKAFGKRCNLPSLLFNFIGE
jgi:hypothetical protein